MDSEIEAYLDEFCAQLDLGSGRKHLIRQEMASHIEEMLAEQPIRRKATWSIGFDISLAMYRSWVRI